MSLKEISDAMEKKNVYLGLKQALKYSKKSKSKKFKVFVSSDAREQTLKKLEDAGITFSKVKNTVDTKKELNLGFECEVFSIK